MQKSQVHTGKLECHTVKTISEVYDAHKAAKFLLLTPCYLFYANNNYEKFEL